MRRGLVLVAGFILLGCADPVNPVPQLCAQRVLPSQAIVTIQWTGSADEMHVLVTSPATVAAACAFIAGTSNASIPSGRITVGAGPADPRVPFHYVPETVQFVQVAIELCDSALLKTPQAVAAFFAGTGSDIAATAPYCPWGARPVDVRQYTPLANRGETARLNRS